jgi:UDP-N-acetylglucosamine/UDP-N-acetylgalactosamine diphosphorylase
MDPRGSVKLLLKGATSLCEGGEVASNRPESGDFAELRARFEACGQAHVFRFWPELDAAERERLQTQAEGMDLEGAIEGLRDCLARAEKAPPALEPVELVALPERGGDPQARKEATARGEEALAEGRVAVMVVAGGQASRLGFSGPKGAYPIGPVSDRSLFGLQAQKIHRLRSRYGRAIPWYVMTSPATDTATRSFFQINGDFGLPDEDVFFFRQSMVPSFDFAGRLMLDRRDHIFENPDGHGGSLTALERSGALDDMAQRGIDTLFYYQVDNPLVRMADPAFLGFHLLRESEISCKVIRKQDPAEKVGVVARIDGRVGVVEYTEIDEDARNRRDASGELVYAAGNTAIHVFARDFVRRVAGQAASLLPFHASAKKIPVVDDSGRVRAPEEPNGHKLERFVFDALGASERVSVVEADRGSEYSPVKNAEGTDSPATARRDLCAVYRHWLHEAGLTPPAADAMIEIDHEQADGVEDLRALGIRSVREAGGAIRIAAGDET